MSEVICAIDIGSSQLSVMVAKASKLNESETQKKTSNFNDLNQYKKPIEVLTYQSVPCSAMRHGLIVDIEKTIEALEVCIEKVSVEIGQPIKNACISISQKNTQSFVSKGIARVQSSQVSHDDIQNAVELAEVFNFSNNQELLHSIIQRFWLDGELINNPIDIHGVRLEVDCLLIPAQKQILDNLYFCLNKCDVEIKDALISPYSNVLSTLTGEDKQFGSILLDVGAGVTNVAIYQDNALTYLNSFAIAGNQITEAIADYLHISIAQAEQLKKDFGCAEPNQLENPEEQIPIFSIRQNQENSISLGEFSGVVSGYYRQALEAIRDQIKKEHSIDNFENLGVVLTGGLSSAASITQLVRAVFNCQAVRVGYPDAKKISALPDDMNLAELSNIAGIMIQANQIYHQKEKALLGLSNLNNRSQIEPSYPKHNKSRKSKQNELTAKKQGFLAQLIQFLEKHF